MTKAHEASVSGAVKALIESALDLLQEKKYGNRARSPGHNAQLELKAALAALSSLEQPSPAAVTEANTWQRMETAPKNGKHVLLCIQSGPFFYAVEGSCHAGKWLAAFINKEEVKPVYWAWKPTGFVLPTATNDAAAALSATEQPAAVGEPLPGYVENALRVVQEHYDLRRSDLIAALAPASAEAELRAKVERLTKERDRHIRDAGSHFAKSCELADRALTAEEKLEAAEARAEALKARLDTALEALEPFSIIAGEYFAQNLNRDDIVASIKRPDGTRLDITAGHLFDARDRSRQIREDSANG